METRVHAPRSRAGTKVTVAALLKAGADPGAADACGATPRDLAAGAGHERLLDLLSAAREGGAERGGPAHGADAPCRPGAAAVGAPGGEAQRSGAGDAARPQPDQARGEADGAAQQRAPGAPGPAAAAAAAAPAREPPGGGGAAPAHATLSYREPDQEGQEDGEAALVDALAAELSARQAAAAALATERAERAAEAQVPRHACRTDVRVATRPCRGSTACALGAGALTAREGRAGAGANGQQAGWPVPAVKKTRCCHAVEAGSPRCSSCRGCAAVGRRSAGAVRRAGAPS
jgi:hypothetical protein